jgi:hypothetical protein
MKNDTKQEVSGLPFKTFPEFSKLTLNDRKMYENAIIQYPPFIDASFPMLMTWWSAMDKPQVSALNDNLVISYFMPGVEDYSGLALIGTNQIDETICTIFDEQQSRGEKAQLKHVPEFVLSQITHPQLFTFESERHLDEYILQVGDLYPISRLPGAKRIKVQKRLVEAKANGLRLKSVDLSERENQQLLIGKMLAWPVKGFNQLTAWEIQAQKNAIENSVVLGYENVCIYVGEELQGFFLYQLPTADKRYAFTTYMGVYERYIDQYEFIMYLLASWFSELGILYINIDADLNIPCFRSAKLPLGPANYVRKYTITPSKLMSIE